MWHPVKQQNSEEPCPCCGKTWMELRAGKITGSNMAKIMANYGKAFGDPAKRLAVDIAVIELGGSITENGYTNADMERGHEQEPIARKLYEDEHFIEVSSGGFFDNGQTGTSPDGLVYDDGIIEIKSVINPQHYACIVRNCYDPAYKWQIHHELKEADREWLDYISFCSTFPKDKKLFVYRLYSESAKKEFSMIEQRIKEFRELVEKTKENIQHG